MNDDFIRTRSDREYPVLIKRGDAHREVDQLLDELRLSPDEAGLHKCIVVARANQTVVMVTDRAAPIARALRTHMGWLEPADDE